MSFDTRKLVKKIEDRRGPLPFILRRYFPTIMEFETEEVNFDYVFEGRKLAPFVSPVVAGKALRSEGATHKSFTPAYVKPKHVVRPARAMKRLPGEPLNGAMSPKQRLEIIKAENFLKEDRMIDNRVEWMAMQILRTGSVVVQGEDYPTRTVDFGRNTNLSITLTGAARWDQSGADPVQDLEDASKEMALSPFGAPATDVIFSATPWSLFRKHPDVKDLIDTTYRGNEGSAVNRGPVNSADDVQYMGRLNNFDLWLDTRQYEDDAGNAQLFLPDGEVLMATPLIGGVQTYGAIQDVEALVAARAWPKTWSEKDPSVTYTMTQSAPLPIPEKHNASARLTVISP